ncbi:hypothetical protein SADUNF_Sadunf19G0106300 [Salix dunnii]|uniref:Uncharacterized protein n=1 Tax=Salix dunnii TaxID=1413687 RepID=A0A835J4X3_9ROSI|nr:hypothetical protein SADUNF_Sadunf19G0106300 [Salix dunnii]
MSPIITLFPKDYWISQLWDVGVEEITAAGLCRRVAGLGRRDNMATESKVLVSSFETIRRFASRKRPENPLKMSAVDRLATVLFFLEKRERKTERQL